MEFYKESTCQNRPIDNLRLEQMDRVVNGWRIDRQRRDALALYRGKSRTLWTDEEKEAAKEYYGKVSMKGGDGGI
jgi:hypothetical protein